MRGIDSESRLQVREIQSSGRHGRQLTQRWKDSHHHLTFSPRFHHARRSNAFVLVVQEKLLMPEY